MDESANPRARYFNTTKLYSILILLYFKADKYTGQWDGWKGQGQINYRDGTKYIGQWDDFGESSIDFKRHGLGTLYSAHGQVLNQGKWYRGEYKGKE